MRLRCPFGNTDPTTELALATPQCYCGDPDLPPDGYSLSSGVWACAPGYVGTPEKRCRGSNGTCASEVLLSGCMVPAPCGVKAFSDEDGRQNMISGRLAFGAAQVNGVITEAGVESYQVFLADDCGRLVSGSPVAVVPKWQTVADTSCCEVERYSVNLMDLELPPAATHFLLAVNGGTVGTTVTFKDFYDPRIAKIAFVAESQPTVVSRFILLGCMSIPAFCCSF